MELYMTPAYVAPHARAHPAMTDTVSKGYQQVAAVATSAAMSGGVVLGELEGMLGGGGPF